MDLWTVHSVDLRTDETTKIVLKVACPQSQNVAKALDGQPYMAGIWVSRLGFEPRGWDLSLAAGIWALKLGFEPPGWDLSLEAGIKASRLDFGSRSWDLSLEDGKNV